MERFIKVTVAKEMLSEVYIKVDDNDPRFADCFNKQGKFLGFRCIPPLLVEKAAEKTLQDYDWETDPDVSAFGSKEVEKAEATVYQTWDATNDKIYYVEVKDVVSGDNSTNQC